jgi:hypothetical protein
MIKAGKVTQPLDPQARRHPAPPTEPIKVRATALLYHNDERKRIGDVFIIAAEEFTPGCMEIVDARTRERTTSAPQALKQAHDEILGGQVSKRENDANILD